MLFDVMTIQMFNIIKILPTQQIFHSMLENSKLQKKQQKSIKNVWFGDSAAAHYCGVIALGYEKENRKLSEYSYQNIIIYI